MPSALETLLLPFSPKYGLAVPSRALFIGAEPHPDLRRWHALAGWQPFKPLADRWDREGFARIDDLPPGERWPVVLILPGKSRDENLAWFALARDRLEPGGRLVAAMPNAIGAARYEKVLAQATGRIESIPKNKCRAFFATEDGTWDERTFDGWRALARRRLIPGTEFVTEPGIFSSEHIDPGSRLLADHLPGDLNGAVADAGAGWGYLSAEALRRCPAIARLDLFEADARALDCARQNLAAHSPRQPIAFHWHDVRSGLPGHYDAILMNPPFHTGPSTQVELGRAFLLAGIAALKTGGHLFLVANRHLPYESVLDAGGLIWQKLAETQVHKVIAARRP